MSGLIKKVTGLSYLTAHNLRHSCLSNIQLLHFLYDSKNSNNIVDADALMDLLPYKKGHSWEIYNKLFGSRKSISNYVIAGIAGHSDPSVSFNNYIHFTDIQIGIQLWNIDYQLNESQKLHLIKLPKLKKNLSIKEAYEYLLKKLKIRPLEKFKGKSKKYASNPNESERRFSFNGVAKIMHSYQMHDDFQQLLRLYDISDDEFKNWHCKIEYLKKDPKYQTKFKKSRLFSPAQNNLLVPSYSLASEDQKIMEGMELDFRKLYMSKKHKECLNWFVRYTLQNCESSQNHVSFKSFEDFRDFLNYTTKLLPIGLIHVDIRNLKSCTDKRVLKKWKFQLNNLPESNVHYKILSSDKEVKNTKEVRASIRIASSKERLKKGKSLVSCSRVLQTFCFYQFILLNNIDDGISV